MLGFNMLSTALRTMKANRLRTALSMLGIVIGVSSVVAMISIGSGARESILRDVSGLGSDIIRISQSHRGPGTRDKIRPNLDSELGLEMAAACPSISKVIPLAFGTVSISGLRGTFAATAIGTTADYVKAMNYRLVSGRLFMDNEVVDDAFSVVLTESLSLNLFGQVDALGRTIRVLSHGRALVLTVVGVMFENTGVSYAYDADLLLPISTMVNRLQRTRAVSSYLAQVATGASSDTAIAEIEAFLTARAGSSEGFTVVSQKALLEALREITGTMTLLLGAIAVISLVVGGIGIMNTMLVSVVERTREIGVRKALGAKKRHIIIQFLVESTVLSVTGGIMGLGLGLLIAGGAARVGGWPVVAVVPSTVMAISFSTAVGLFFGVYPAFRGASLHPAEALRHE